MVNTQPREMNGELSKLTPGTRVRIVQRIRRREGMWTTEVEGEVVDVLNAPTGSWYAHGKDDRYWLKRIRLRKDDGEITLISLDEGSRIILLDEAAKA